MIEGDPFLGGWHRLVAERDLEALGRRLAEDVAMGAPPYWQKLRGHAVVHHLLGLIVDTIEGFSYHREWRDGNELALEFSGRVGEHELQGIDLISLNAAGLIQNLDVLIRPHNAVGALIEVIRPQMIAFLSSQSAGGNEDGAASGVRA